MLLRVADRYRSATVTRRTRWLVGDRRCHRLPLHRRPSRRRGPSDPLLQSSHRGNLTLDRITNDFRVDVEERAGRPSISSRSSVGRSGLSAPPTSGSSTTSGRSTPVVPRRISSWQSLVRRRYSRASIDSSCSRTCRSSSRSDVRFLGDAPLSENETAVSVVNDYPRLIDDILQLLPETRQVFVVTGSGAIGQFWNRNSRKSSSDSRAG